MDTQKDKLRMFSGVDEVELTDEIINQILKDIKWLKYKDLKELQKNGATWNTKRKSIFLPDEYGSSFDDI